MDGGKLLLIDGNSLLFRAFYALPLLHTRDGVYTNGVYGFLTMFNRVTAEVQPSHMVVAFDLDRKTFRNKVYQEYKANRSETPQELAGQFALLREILTAMKVKYVEMPGFEADDLIGTLSKQAEAAGLNTIILTGDGDALQLVSDKTCVYMTKKGITEMIVYDPAAVVAKWEVSPQQMIEIKGLMGDNADNIPGVPGVGSKTAIKLVKEYGSLENLYQHTNEISGKKLKENLLTYRDQAYLSRDLATIRRDIEMGLAIDDFAVRPIQTDELGAIYKRLEFKGLLAALESSQIGEAQSIEGKEAYSALDVRELKTAEEVAAYLNGLTNEQQLAVHIETDYHHPMWARGIKAYVANNQEVVWLDLQSGDTALNWLQPIWEDPTRLKYLHNAKFAQVFLLRKGINLRGIGGDTLLLSYVLDPSFQGETLAEAIAQYLRIDKNALSLAEQVALIIPLYQQLAEGLNDELRCLLEDVEMPLSSILAKMEFAGIKLEKRVLAQISEELNLDLDKDEDMIYQLAGVRFNINSPKQLAQVLFEDLGLPGGKKTKSGYSTSQEVLENLLDQHEIIPYIINYRQLSKLKSTYTDALQSLIHPETGRVHTIFKQALTATGRLSSVEPNLQNIPIRMEVGRRIRKAFAAGSNENLLFTADYSQIDLRALAHISGDETLIDTFQRGIDIHARTAAEIFKIPLERVDENLRRRAKAVNFGIIYGISDFGLARDTGVSRHEAGEYIKEYLNSYPGVQQYMQDVVDFGKKYGYVETALGRRRYLPDLRAKNKMLQAFARRMALNTPIQGTSADIIKLAMIKVADTFKHQGLKARLLLQVHDELLLEVPRQELEETAEVVRNCMENAYSLKVPLLVSMKVGTNWYEMQAWE